MRLTSSAFGDGERIPERYTADGEDLSVPLSWTDPPDETAELALIVDDPDAPGPESWVHWVLYNIPSDSRELAEGIPRVERPVAPEGAAQGLNSWPSENLGYRGPAPPRGHGRHRYRFVLYALDEELDLSAGMDRDALVSAMEGHVAAETRLTGVYER
ncbi:MAG: YbhB/YbcL family Raf kinase inhibitor-like protein [Gemmatimonadota bacterium]